MIRYFCDVCEREQNKDGVCQECEDRIAKQVEMRVNEIRKHYDHAVSSRSLIVQFAKLIYEDDDYTHEWERHFGTVGFQLLLETVCEDSDVSNTTT